VGQTRQHPSVAAIGHSFSYQIRDEAGLGQSSAEGEETENAQSQKTPKPPTQGFGVAGAHLSRRSESEGGTSNIQRQRQKPKVSRLYVGLRRGKEVGSENGRERGTLASVNISRVDELKSH